LALRTTEAFTLKLGRDVDDVVVTDVVTLLGWSSETIGCFYFSLRAHLRANIENSPFFDTTAAA
jgi:hypothetical protein